MAIPPDPALGSRVWRVTTSGIGRPVTCSVIAIYAGGNRPPVQRVGQVYHPPLVEVVKITRFQPRPIVNWHHWKSQKIKRFYLTPVCRSNSL